MPNYNYGGYPVQYPVDYSQQYNPYYQQPRWQNPQQSTAIPSYSNTQNVALNTNIIWVQGASGERGYIVPNGNTVVLFDSEDQVIYIKSVDMNGKPSMAILDYQERDQVNHKSDKSTDVEYATKTQVDELSNHYSSIAEKLDNMQNYVTNDQFNYYTSQLNDLSSQIKDIENRIMSFGKPSQNTNRKGSNNG